MPTIRNLAEKRYWQGRADLVHQHHPVAAVEDRRAQEIGDGVLYLKSMASVTAVDTGDGLVMLDTGGVFDRDVVYESVRAWRPSARLSAAIFSHHHVDHIFGTARFEAEAEERAWAPPKVYGHIAMAEHLRRYERTRGWNTQRQFGLPVDRFRWPTGYRFPDITYDDRLTFRQGRLTLELHHGRGETDEATWTWVPELRLVHPGDLSSTPSRTPATRRRCAALPERLGRGAPRDGGAGRGRDGFWPRPSDFRCRPYPRGAHRHRRAPRRGRGQALTLMNEGRTLDQVIHAVEIPPHLAGKAYLRPVYDHPQFLVRNVWRRYGGWYDGEPDNLLPAPRAAQAREWVRLAGGTAAVVARAIELGAGGDGRLGCHLAEFAVLAEPASGEAHAARADLYRARAGE